MTPFDEAMLPKELQMLKAFLPFLPVSMQKMLAIYIKWTELRNVIEYYNRNPPVQLSPEGGNLMPQRTASPGRASTDGAIFGPV